MRKAREQSEKLWLGTVSFADEECMVRRGLYAKMLHNNKTAGFSNCTKHK